jgi:hypothetical protein
MSFREACDEKSLLRNNDKRGGWLEFKPKLWIYQPHRSQK